MTNLEILLKELAEYRNQLEDVRGQEAEAHCDMMLTPEYKTYADLAAEATFLKGVVAGMEEKLRYMIAAEATTTGNRKPAPCAEAKRYKVYVYDANEAETWTRTNMPAILKFDPKAFEKVASEINGAPITIENEWRGQIARDLSEYLDK